MATYRNREELRKELQRERPKKEIILSLSRQTFYSLLTEFPEFWKPYVVCIYLSPTPISINCLTQSCIKLEQDINLILENNSTFNAALQDWTNKWVPIILEYSMSLSGRKATLATEIRKDSEGVFFLHHIYTFIAI